MRPFAEFLTTRRLSDRDSLLVSRRDGLKATPRAAVLGR